MRHTEHALVTNKDKLYVLDPKHGNIFSGGWHSTNIALQYYWLHNIIPITTNRWPSNVERSIFKTHLCISTHTARIYIITTYYVYSTTHYVSTPRACGRVLGRGRLARPSRARPRAPTFAARANKNNLTFCHASVTEQWRTTQNGCCYKIVHSQTTWLQWGTRSVHW